MAPKRKPTVDAVHARLAGDVLLDMEPLIGELVEAGLQWGDILALVYVHLSVHCPEAREVYTADGLSPEFYYGPARTPQWKS